ncbi:nuclear transport factor 2 family protein [Streptococcus sp. S784/96/1]|uniref:nuclear transport factor 2 family protein n=1 Tax=Streptococcus sp. S784/96/1 TaxID=2653499 RepID=UPI00138660A0|nr:nuclear transport factor 2 family protein [Streptococcus sp. S784/96/1]
MTQTAEKEIIALQHEIWEAIIARDFDQLHQLYPEDHLFCHVGGYYQTREEYFDYIRGGTFRYYTYVPISETVRFINDKRAILHAKAKTDARIYGFRKVWTMDFELPFERIEGRWQPANEN